MSLMNKLSSLFHSNDPQRSSSSNIQESEDEDDISYTTEATPIMGIASSSSKATSRKNKNQGYDDDDENDNDENHSYSKAICTYLKQNYTFVIIAFLSLVILALAGENASIKGKGQVVANLQEDSKSALHIQQRPCQIYIVNDIDDKSNSGSTSNLNSLPSWMSPNDNVKIIQTSLGSPNLHWDEVPCLVRRNDVVFQFEKLTRSSENNNNDQWGWIFGSSSSSTKTKSSNYHQDEEEPIEYGLPSAEIRIDFTTIAHPNRQPVLGFGGAFTEASALNYMSLNKDGRNAVMSLLFGKEHGLGYSLGRVHMNSCDFSVQSYNFDDVDGDFNLTNFDKKVEHDVNSGMVEMMLAASGKLRDEWDEKDGGLRIIASPWSPPAWMKIPTYKDPFGALHAVNMTFSAEPNCLREGTGPDSRYAASWALYFSKFLSAYKAWGIDLFAVTVQNEPEFPAPWEACAYDPENEAEFITNHLGPVLRRDHPDVKLLIFDHNKDHAVMWANSILNATNPASKFVDGTAVHWYAGGMDRLLDGAQGAPNMHRLLSLIKNLNVKPDHLVLGSESCHCPSTGYAGGDLSVAWARAERYAHTILSDLAAGSNGWVEWNLVLDALGGPNHLGNMCDAPILAVPYRVGGKHNVTVLPTYEHADFPFGPVVGDTRTREELDAMGFPAEYLDKGIVVQPMFYYMGHISRHVRPGSRAVPAIVDQSMGSSSRTFLKSVNNDIVVGGGINNLARPGVEITLWPCEGSTRQQWTLNDNGHIEVFGHDWLGKPTKTCMGKSNDPSFQGLLLAPCNNNAGIFRFESDISSNSTKKILIGNSQSLEGDNCLIAKPLQNNGGAYGPRGGAQLVIGSCDIEAAMWNFNDTIGEISSNYFDTFGGEVCVTTGWPFLQVGAFIGSDDGKNKTVVVLNEASEPANYILRNEKGQVILTNSIPSHSIQTVVL